VDLVARAVLGMSEPSPDRMLSAGAPPAAGERSGLPSEDGIPRKEPP
jgi:hypothetical protein